MTCGGNGTKFDYKTGGDGGGTQVNEHTLLTYSLRVELDGFL